MGKPYNKFLLIVLCVLLSSHLEHARAASLAQCLESALIDLQSRPLLQQEDPKLMERGLIPPDSLSKLCGPTCGSYLMEAVRNALKIPSHYSSMDAEIESLTKVGFFLGNNVTHRGMGLFQLRAAVFGDLTEHGISATAEVQSLKVERLTSLNEFKTVSEIRIGELLPPLETAQVSIIAADPLHSNDQGHFYLVQKIETQDKLIWLIDPLRPYAPVIVPYQEVWNEKGTRELLLGNPPAVSVQGFLRVRLPSPK